MKFMIRIIVLQNSVYAQCTAHVHIYNTNSMMFVVSAGIVSHNSVSAPHLTPAVAYLYQWQFQILDKYLLNRSLYYNR